MQIQASRLHIQRFSRERSITIVIAEIAKRRKTNSVNSGKNFPSTNIAPNFFEEVKSIIAGNLELSAIAWLNAHAL